MNGIGLPFDGAEWTHKSHTCNQARATIIMARLKNWRVPH